jgi:formate dehydrogenase iron-sulfur subunit
VGALQKTPEGPVVYEAQRCIGCRYCQYACPFGIPTYDWDNPLGLIHKCQMCVTRLAEGKSPACVVACPNGALRFGKRRDLLAQAHAQIASSSGRYVDQVYGEHEVGGTSVLYLAPAPFSELGFPALGSEPIPETAETVMNLTPVTALMVASVASALHWVTRRRQRQPGPKDFPTVQRKSGGSPANGTGENDDP